MDYDLYPFPPEREIVVDAGYLGTGRHIIYALVELDVTRARELLRAASATEGRALSFTAFLAASLAQAIASHARVQAYRDWRRRLVVFHDVDVVAMIEPEPGAVAVPRIIRAANRKAVLEISDEIRSFQGQPQVEKRGGSLTAFAPRVPRFVRLGFFRLLKWNPHWFKRLSGTVIVTSVGMFGRGSGWGLGFLPLHTLGILVGGITSKPAVHEGEIVIREFLNLTISFDHDIVDGAPAARFVRSLAVLVEGASALEPKQVAQPSEVAMSLPVRSEIRPGLTVQIVEKQNQRSGATTEGVVARVLTNSPTHPHGIKVMLEDGRVGRVKAIVTADA